jgi:hypothetical protein
LLRAEMMLVRMHMENSPAATIRITFLRFFIKVPLDA